MTFSRPMDAEASLKKSVLTSVVVKIAAGASQLNRVIGSVIPSSRAHQIASFVRMVWTKDRIHLASFRHCSIRVKEYALGDLRKAMQAHSSEGGCILTPVDSLWAQVRSVTQCLLLVEYSAIPSRAFFSPFQQMIPASPMSFF